MQQIFWKKWSLSYLSLLQERFKWKSKSKPICTGDLFLIKDENAPPLKWQMDRVTDVICGKDEVARVVMVRTTNGVTKRAVAKIAVLRIDDSLEALCASRGKDV